jgi:hypothetical protein
MASTAQRGYPTPELSDPPNVPADVWSLAAPIDADIASLQSAVSSMQTALTQQNAKITSMQSQINTLQSAVDAGPAAPLYTFAYTGSDGRAKPTGTTDHTVNVGTPITTMTLTVPAKATVVAHGAACLNGQASSRSRYLILDIDSNASLTRTYSGIARHNTDPDDENSPCYPWAICYATKATTVTFRWRVRFLGGSDMDSVDVYDSRMMAIGFPG